MILIPKINQKFQVEATGQERLIIQRRLIRSWRRHLTRPLSIKQALLYCHNIKFVPEVGEVYMSPDILLAEGGDCDDFTLFLGCFLYYYVLAPVHLELDGRVLHSLLIVSSGNRLISIDGSAYSSKDPRWEKREQIFARDIKSLYDIVQSEYCCEIKTIKQGWLQWVQPKI